MKTISATEARAKLSFIIDATNKSHEPIQISGKRFGAVLVATEDWNSIQETMYLVSIPGMRESIVEGMKAPLSKFKNKLKL